MAESNLSARGKYVCLLIALDISPSGRVDLGAKEEWVSRLSARSGLSPKDVEKALEAAKASGWLTVVRHRDAAGNYSLYSIRQSRPRFDGGQDVQVFVSQSKATLEDDVRAALATDTRERVLQPVLGWE